MYTESTHPAPRFEVEFEERMGEHEVTTRITVEGLKTVQMLEAIYDVLRFSRLMAPTAE